MLAMLSSTGLAIGKDELDDVRSIPLSSCRVAIANSSIADVIFAFPTHCSSPYGMNSVELDLVLLLAL